MDLKGLTAVELGKKIQAKEVTVKEAVEACFAQIDKVEKELNRWEESYKFIDITTASKERRYGVNVDWVDFDVVKSIAIGKIKKDLKN